MRRGQADFMLEWFPRMMLLIIAMVIVVMLVRVYTNRDVDASAVERAAMLYRIYYSDIIMSRDTPTGRVYPGIVDAQQCTDARLAAIFPPEQGRPTRLTAMVSVTPGNGCPLSAVACSNDRASFALANAQSGLQGRGAGTAETAMFPVTVIAGGVHCAGILNITVARLNS